MATAQERHPELYTVDKNIDPRTRSRVVPMQVLALGMSRTGTASMAAALEILEYKPCFHGFSIFYNLRDVDMWRDGLQAKYFPEQTSLAPFGRREFDQLLGNYRALCDMPAVMFAPELISAYPEVKIVLVERDIEAWKYRDAGLEYLARIREMTTMMIRGFFRSNTKPELIANARLVYGEHHAEIRGLVGKEKDRLLDYSLDQGWEPLCKFLGKEMPDVPFPRGNDGETLQEKIRIVGKRAMGRILSDVSMVAGAIGAVAVAVYWYRK